MDKRNAELLLAERAKTPYSGNTKWRVIRLVTRWRRTGEFVHDLQSNRKTRTFTEAESQKNQKRPDERVSDSRAYRKYHREGHEWTPPVRRTILRREYAPGRERRRRVRKRDQGHPGHQRRGRTLKIEDARPSDDPTTISDTTDTTMMMAGPTEQRKQLTHNNKKKRRRGSGNTTMLAQPVPVGRVNTSQ